MVLDAGAASDADADSLSEFCKTSLAAYKAPKTSKFIDSLPRTGLRKIDRGKLASIAG